MRTSDNDEVRTVMSKLEWGVLFSVLASAGSIIFSAGIVWTTVQVHEREIASLKSKDDENTDRLARIETKLDIIISEKVEKAKR